MTRHKKTSSEKLKRKGNGRKIKAKLKRMKWSGIVGRGKQIKANVKVSQKQDATKGISNHIEIR